jgi:hypothetical protein
VGQFAVDSHPFIRRSLEATSPNIATNFDFNRQQEIDFLVMSLSLVLLSMTSCSAIQRRVEDDSGHQNR